MNLICLISSQITKSNQIPIFLQNHLEQNVLNDLQQNLVNALLKKAVMVEWSKLDPEQFFKTSFLQQLFPKLLDGRNSAEY